MTLKDYIAKQERRLAELKENKPFALGVLATHTAQIERIFTQGQTAAGAKIGNYSTEPIYVNPDSPTNPVKFGTVGKFGKTKFDNGKSHKTKYFGGGYKQYRATVGRQNAFMDLGLTFDLKFDYARPPRRVTAFVYRAVVVRSNNVKKVKGIQGRKGFIFSRLNPLEVKILTNTIKKERIKLGL